MYAGGSDTIFIDDVWFEYYCFESENCSDNYLCGEGHELNFAWAGPSDAPEA